VLVEMDEGRAAGSMLGDTTVGKAVSRWHIRERRGQQEVTVHAEMEGARARPGDGWGRRAAAQVALAPKGKRRQRATEIALTRGDTQQKAGVMGRGKSARGNLQWAAAAGLSRQVW
jgi:hypothetical protein